MPGNEPFSRLKIIRNLIRDSHVLFVHIVHTICTFYNQQKETHLGHEFSFIDCNI
jgi:hypothetical protein